MIYRAFHIRRHEFHLMRREQKVRIKTYKGGLCTYHAESLNFAASSPAEIVAVHKVSQVPVRIRIEYVGKFVSLIAEVLAGPVGEHDIVGLLTLLTDIAVLAPVREQCDSTGTLKSLAAALEAFAGAESRVSLQCHSLGLLKCCKPRTYAGTCGDIDGMREHLRTQNRPLQCLKSAHAGAHKQVDLVNAEMYSDQVECTGDIAHGNLRK